jgi:lipoate-protein ligase B
MRKQELKSRKKVHAHKRKKKKSHAPTAKEEITIVEHRPEVFTLGK